MMDGFIGVLVGVVIAGVITLPIAISVAQKFSKYHLNSASVVQGGVLYLYLWVLPLAIFVPEFTDKIDLDSWEWFARISMAGMIGMGIGLCIMGLDRIGGFSRLPFIGRRLNAYSLATARYRRERLDKEIRRYEELDASYATV